MQVIKNQPKTPKPPVDAVDGTSQWYSIFSKVLCFQQTVEFSFEIKQSHISITTSQIICLLKKKAFYVTKLVYKTFLQ